MTISALINAIHEYVMDQLPTAFAHVAQVVDETDLPAAVPMPCLGIIDDGGDWTNRQTRQILIGHKVSLVVFCSAIGGPPAIRETTQLIELLAELLHNHTFAGFAPLRVTGTTGTYALDDAQSDTATCFAKTMRLVTSSENHY